MSLALHQLVYQRRYSASIFLLLLLILSFSIPVSAQSDTQMFVIGEITNIPGGGISTVTVTPTAPPATPTPASAVPVPTFTTNGQVGSRQLSFRASLAE